MWQVLDSDNILRKGLLGLFKVVLVLVVPVLVVLVLVVRGSSYCYINPRKLCLIWVLLEKIIHWNESQFSNAQIIIENILPIK